MFLDRIIAEKQQEIQRLRETLGLKEAEAAIDKMPACRGFTAALVRHRKRKMGLIAEIKKASPSKGLIRPVFDPVALARGYERAGADCISVLTDVPFFQGSNEYLRQVRQAVEVPLLRKDFILDELQIYEARLIGADAVLLIVAALPDDRLARFYRLARDLGMDVLIEVHNREELERALELEPELVGINNRNLHTFETTLDTTRELMPHIPSHVTVVSESGISTPDDIEQLYQIGARAVLIGEHFMRQPDVATAVAELLGPLDGEG